MLPGLGGLEDGVADNGRFIAICKGCAVGGHVFVVGNAVEQVGDLVDKGVFPADHVSLGPPIFPPGMVGFADQDVVEALGFFGLFANPEDVEFVEALQVKADAAFFAVDLQHFGVLVTGGEAGGFERADGSVGKFDGGDKGVVYVYCAGAAAAVGERPFGDEGLG